MPLNLSFSIAVSIGALTSSSMWTGRAAARTNTTDTQNIARVFLPVEPKLSHSPIPVFVPNWLPRIRPSGYIGKVYPGFQIFKRQYGSGPGYDLGLYTSPHVFDYAHMLFDIHGVAGDVLTIDSHTRPVWLGKSGWVYLKSGGNSGTTISFVRSVKHTPPPHEYSYTIIFGCAQAPVRSWPRRIACVKHPMASTKRYIPGSDRS